MAAQRRPGVEPRRHDSMAAQGLGDVIPLNEGRWLDPGDTIRMVKRRHAVSPRSTKAGG